MTKTVPKNFAIFTGKLLCWRLFFHKVADLQACNFIKMRLPQNCFTVAKFLRTRILKNICVRLLLISLCKVIVWNFVSGQSLSKPSLRSINTEVPVAFKSER